MRTSSVYYIQTFNPCRCIIIIIYYNSRVVHMLLLFQPVIFVFTADDDEDDDNDALEVLMYSCIKYIYFDGITCRVNKTIKKTIYRPPGKTDHANVIFPFASASNLYKKV